MPNIEHNQMYFMYENINDKIYLNTNDVTYKIETLENKALTEGQYKKELNKFEKYFEENEYDNSIYNQDN